MSLAAAIGGLHPVRWLRRSRPEVGTGPLLCNSTSRTHVGLVRTVNEDRVLDMPEAGLWAVIDGMGGHAAGDLAAEAVLDALRRLGDAGTPALEAVVAALETVNRALHEAGREAGSIRGATVVVLLRAGDGFSVCWVGDCRAYRQRGAALAQLTRDHSVVQDLIDAGQLTEQEAAVHPRGNVVTRALGAAATVIVDTRPIAVEAGDLLILCSDGLNRAVLDRSRLKGRLGATADSLLAAAIEKDGRDNVSLVLIGVTRPERQAAAG